MILLDDIYKSYGQVAVLKGVSCTIQRGEIVSVVGPSGAGKSTLLHIIGGLDSADSGNSTIDGVNLSQLSQRNLAQFRNEKIGFVFQFHHLLPEFTALENVCMPGFIAGKNKSQAEIKGKKLLTSLGLKSRITHFPAQLSGGEQQRVAVARALFNDPAVVLADEPSGNLDTKTAHELHSLFFKLRDELGQTFVIVTHNDQLAEATDKVLRMVDGVIVNDSKS